MQEKARDLSAIRCCNSPLQPASVNCSCLRCENMKKNINKLIIIYSTITNATSHAMHLVKEKVSVLWHRGNWILWHSTCVYVRERERCWKCGTFTATIQWTTNQITHLLPTLLVSLTKICSTSFSLSWKKHTHMHGKESKNNDKIWVHLLVMYNGNFHWCIFSYNFKFSIKIKFRKFNFRIFQVLQATPRGHTLG